jgi:H+/Cl- antiporter ClcA
MARHGEAALWARHRHCREEGARTAGAGDRSEQAANASQNSDRMKFPSHRQRRLIKVTSARWQRRAIFLLGGIAVGAAAVALAKLADLAQLAFSDLVSKFRYASLVVTPTGFALSVFLTNRFFRNAQGSGIPQAIAARHLTDQPARQNLVSLRIAAGKIILTLFGLPSW